MTKDVFSLPRPLFPPSSFLAAIRLSGATLEIARSICKTSTFNSSWRILSLDNFPRKSFRYSPGSSQLLAKLMKKRVSEDCALRKYVWAIKELLLVPVNKVIAQDSRVRRSGPASERCLSLLSNISHAGPLGGDSPTQIQSFPPSYHRNALLGGIYTRWNSIRCSFLIPVVGITYEIDTFRCRLHGFELLDRHRQSAPCYSLWIHSQLHRRSE